MFRRMVIAMVLGLLAGSAWAAGEHAVSGTVNKVDDSAGKLNISHGPIKTMGMEGMTMDFLVEDPAMLEDVKKGSTVDFTITQNSKGMFVITDIEVTGTSTASADHGHNH